MYSSKWYRTTAGYGLFNTHLDMFIIEDPTATEM